MDDAQLLRYSRHVLLPQVGVEGQKKIGRSRVLLIGLGGLGSAVSLYLASAGVAELILVDDDRVDLGNLQRQIVHSESSLGVNKAESAAQRLNAINPEPHYRVIPHRLSDTELLELAGQCDLIVDACDNFATRYQLNRISLRSGKALVSGAAIRFEGQVGVFNRQANSACYRCLYPEESAEEVLNCSETGVFAPLVGIVGSLQALEALKLLADIGQSLDNRLLLFDALRQQWRTLQLSKDSECPDCA